MSLESGARVPPSRRSWPLAAEAVLRWKSWVAALFGVLWVASVGSPTAANAAPIFQNFDGSELGVDSIPAATLLARVRVEGSDVPITGLGIHGDLSVDGNARAVIFASPGPLPVDPLTPLTRLFMTDPVPVTAAGGSAWYDVTGFEFNLTANTDYYLGVIFDQNFDHYWDSAAGTTLPLTQNGLTSPGSSLNGSNGRVENFADPSGVSAGNVLPSLRVFGVPEPATLGLFAAGLLAIGLFQRDGRGS